jgi:hypothetical protein
MGDFLYAARHSKGATQFRATPIRKKTPYDHL